MHELLTIVASGMYGTVDVLDAIEDLMDMGCPDELLDGAIDLLVSRTITEVGYPSREYPFVFSRRKMDWAFKLMPTEREMLELARMSNRRGARSDGH